MIITKRGNEGERSVCWQFEPVLQRKKALKGKLLSCDSNLTFNSVFLLPLLFLNLCSNGIFFLAKGFLASIYNYAYSLHTTVQVYTPSV